MGRTPGDGGVIAMNTSPLERVSGVAALLAPVVLLVGTIAFFTIGGGIGVGTVAGVAVIFAMICFAIAVVGLARSAEPAAPVLAAVVTVGGLAGAAGGVGFGVDSIQAQLFGTPGLDAVSLAGVLALRVPGLLFPLSMVALAVLLGVSGRAPRGLAAALALAAVLFPLGRIGGLMPVAIASDLLFIGAMGTLGLGLLRGTVRRSRPERREAVPA
jgi:hypothetical protein